MTGLVHYEQPFWDGGMGGGLSLALFPNSAYEAEYVFQNY